MRSYFGRTEPDTAAPKPVFDPKFEQKHDQQELGRAKPRNSGLRGPNRKQLPIRLGVVGEDRELFSDLR